MEFHFVYIFHVLVLHLHPICTRPTNCTKHEEGKATCTPVIEKFRYYVGTINCEDAELTQVEVVQRLSNHQSYVSKCKSGERRVDFVELLDFAELYKKLLVYLLLQVLVN